MSIELSKATPQSSAQLPEVQGDSKYSRYMPDWLNSAIERIVKIWNAICSSVMNLLGYETGSKEPVKRDREINLKEINSEIVLEVSDTVKVESQELAQVEQVKIDPVLLLTQEETETCLTRHAREIKEQIGMTKCFLADAEKTDKLIESLSEHNHVIWKDLQGLRVFSDLLYSATGEKIGKVCHGLFIHLKMLKERIGRDLQKMEEIALHFPTQSTSLCGRGNSSYASTHQRFAVSLYSFLDKRKGMVRVENSLERRSDAMKVNAKFISTLEGIYAANKHLVKTVSRSSSRFIEKQEKLLLSYLEFAETMQKNDNKSPSAFKEFVAKLHKLDVEIAGIAKRDQNPRIVELYRAGLKKFYSSVI